MFVDHLSADRFGSSQVSLPEAVARWRVFGCVCGRGRCAGVSRRAFRELGSFLLVGLLHHEQLVEFVDSFVEFQRPGLVRLHVFVDGFESQFSDPHS